MLLLAGTAEPFYDNPVFWVGVSFVILIGFALRQGAAGAIAKALDDRAGGIKREIDEALRLREEAHALLEDSKRKHASAEQEAAQIVAAARQEAESLAAETRRNLKDSVERRTKMAEDKIARAEAQAVAEVRSASADLAVAAAEKLIAGKAAVNGSALIEKSIADLKGRLF